MSSFSSGRVHRYRQREARVQHGAGKSMFATDPLSVFFCVLSGRIIADTS